MAIKLLLSKREAAKRLGIDRGTTLEYLIETGRLRTVTIVGRVRIPVAELDRLCADFDRASNVSPRKSTSSASPPVLDLRAELRRHGF